MRGGFLDYHLEFFECIFKECNRIMPCIVDNAMSTKRFPCSDVFRHIINKDALIGRASDPLKRFLIDQRMGFDSVNIIREDTFFPRRHVRADDCRLSDVATVHDLICIREQKFFLWDAMQERVQCMIFIDKYSRPHHGERFVVDAFRTGKCPREFMEKSRRRDRSALQCTKVFPIPMGSFVQKYRFDFFWMNTHMGTKWINESMKIKCRADIAEIKQQYFNRWLFHALSPVTIY